MKRSLVLLGINNENEKGVLTLEEKRDFVEGRVRLYNFGSEPDGILSIGFYNGNKVDKIGMTKVSNMLYTFKTDKYFDENYSCAVVNFRQGELSPLLFSAKTSIRDREQQLNNVLAQVFDKPISVDEISNTLEQENVVYSESYQREIEQEIDKELNKNDCVDCANCKYKKAFYENKCQIKKVEEPAKNNFFNDISNQVDTLFEKNEREDYLESIIPNSKWVKVAYEDDGDYYILGLIYEDENIKYLVYGVPSVYQKVPPKEIAGYPVWFPLDKERRESFGYWLSYQDAETGESIKAVVE